MKQFRTFVKLFKILTLIGWFFSVLFLTIAMMLYFGGTPATPQSITMIGFLSILFLGCLTAMTPIFFITIFGKSWINGRESLEKERLKMIEESDKYIEARMNVNKWLEMQMKKDLEKGE